MSRFLLASAQFPVSEPRSFSEVEDGLSRWVEEATQAGARLLVFPEYASLTLAALLPEPARADLTRQVAEVQRFRELYVELHQRLARESAAFILAGSFPWLLADGRVVNRAWLCSPQGGLGFQDKQIMTRFERESWGIEGGVGLRVFETMLGKLAVNICYDSEFPLLARAQAEAGAELFLVPSCTDTARGYHRVRVAARARALENQCWFVQSPLVGEAAWSPAIDVNVGRAGVFGPPDHGFPEDGVLAQGELNRAQWVYAEVDLDAVGEVRAQGQVFNHRHWVEQHASPEEARAALPPVELVQL